MRIIVVGDGNLRRALQRATTPLTSNAHPSQGPPQCGLYLGPKLLVPVDLLVKTSARDRRVPLPPESF